MNPLILDTDGGVDDAQALMMLIAAGRLPFAITTVFGNVELQQATDNILAVLAVAKADVPVHAGAAMPLAQDLVNAKNIHGEDGLGGVKRPAVTARAESDDAVGFLGKTLLEAATKGQKIDLLMIGPLTNLALALRANPKIVEGIGQLTIMGGTLTGRGNVTATAEFNIFADPEAAQIVFAADINTLVVPWEPCLEHKVMGPEFDTLVAELPDTPVKKFMVGLVGHARATTQSYGHPDQLLFVDHFAAAALVHPKIVTKSIEASVDVALAQGITRGMTVVDPRQRIGTPAVTLIEEADQKVMTDMLLAAVAYTPKN